LVSVDDLLAASIRDPTRNDALRQQYRKYRFRDTIFLYFMSLSMIINSVAIVFTMTSASCSSEGSDTAFNHIVEQECLFLSSFAVVVLAARIWFFRAYLQYPIIATWNQHEVTTLEKAMNVIHIVLCLGCLVLYVVMFNEIKNENFSGAIIATCCLAGLTLLTSAWYKLVIMNNIRRAIDVYISSSTAPPIAADAVLV
jgi:hypothetical protein